MICEYGAVQLFKEYLYALSPPSRSRTVPMQILAVGPSRSGTISLRTALLQLGYDHTYHGIDVFYHPEDDIVWQRLRLKREQGFRLEAADFDKVIGHCAGVTDHAAAAFASELIQAYPDAKVILNVRKDVDAWHNSVMRTIMPTHQSWKFWLQSWFCADLFWVQDAFYRGNWNTFYRGSFEKHSREVLDDHCRMVRDLVPPERLLEWDVNDGWAPLCAFLNHPEPDTTFPSLNSNMKYTFQARVDRANTNIRRCVLGVAGIGVLWALLF